MRRLLAVSVAVLLLSGCTTAEPQNTPKPSSPSPATSAPSPEVDAAVSVIVISGRGLTTQNADGDTLDSVAFGDGEASLAEFITEATKLEPVIYEDSQICIVPYTQYSWGVAGGNGAITLHVPAEPNPPVLDTFVWSGESSVNGIQIRSSAGFAVGDDISAIPETLPAPQTVGLHANISDGGSPDPTSFVYDPVGEIEVDGVVRSYGGAVLAEAGIARTLFSPRTTKSVSC